jgi:hypothetical protein
VSQLLGYVGSKPNTADGDSRQSVAIAEAVLQILDLTDQVPGGQRAGSSLEAGVHGLLAMEMPRLDPSRPWVVGRGGQISRFRQYAHLARVDDIVKHDRTLRVELGLDYMISPDVTVSFDHGDGDEPPVLHAAISCKFSIRSDRVQNIRHEGVGMIRHRRGRQPHIVTVTSEPLPSRLAAICRGTGEVDAVYHVCLPELTEAVEAVGNATQAEDLAESVGQHRLFDLGDLSAHLTL